MKLPLSKAIKKARLQRFLGWFILLTSGTLILMSLLLSLYNTSINDTSAFKAISQGIATIIAIIYQKTQFMKFMWQYAPPLHYPDIFTIHNLKFLAILSSLVIGGIMRDSGNHLAQRINKAIKNAEERQWENSLTGEKQYNIDIVIKSKDSWYTRPFGIIGMAIVAGYIVNILSNISGL